MGDDLAERFAGEPEKLYGHKTQGEDTNRSGFTALTD